LQHISRHVHQKPDSFLRDLKAQLEAEGHLYDYDTIRLARAYTLRQASDDND
jgi:hypothetical protein